MDKRSFVMMIDDDQSILNLITRVLEIEGAGDASENVREVLNRLSASSPNLVIMDIETPDFEGPELLEELRDGLSTPALMLTTRCEVTTLRDALAACSHRSGAKASPSREIMAGMLTKLRKATPGAIGSN